MTDAASVSSVSKESPPSEDPKESSESKPAAEFDPQLSGGSMMDSYRQAHDEIRRRRDVASVTSGSEGSGSVSFERAAGADDVPFRNDAQTHFVWSASHEEMAPRAKSALQPALRIYGLFASAEEAVEHARVVAAVDPSASLMVSPTHEWLVLPRSAARLADAAATQAHVDAVLQADKQAREKSASEFRENVRMQRGGVRPDQHRVDEPESDADAKAIVTPGDATLSKARLGRDAEVRDQSIVAISFLCDTLQTVPEPIFRVYAAFPNTSDGDAWARCAGDVVTDHDIDLCSTCAWLFVNAVDSDKIQKEVHRSSELNAIMQDHKKQPQRCEQFEKWRKEAQPEESSEPRQDRADAPPELS